MRLFLLVLSIFYGQLASAEIFSAKVLAVLDGDTVLIIRVGHAPEKVRLVNIDAPEKDQAFGAQSTQSLSGMVLKRQVKIEVKSLDHYGRLLGNIAVDGREVNAEQVRRGMAWEYSGYNKNHRFVILQNEAQQARRGLWQQTAPLAPWQWRKTHAPSKYVAPRVASKYPTDTLFYDAMCGDKNACSEMLSCDEAQYYLVRCGVTTLDKNGDGMPCESLCLGGK